MNDAVSVGSLQRVGYLDGDSKQRFQFDRFARNSVLQGKAVEEFHHQKWTALVLADLMDGADVGMIQSGCRLGLALEPLQRTRIVCDVVGEELQRDEAM